MSDDIVTRLRLRPTIFRKNQFGDMQTDRAATALFDDCHAIMREAAEEIERLRRNTGCARLQGTTQFCAEALGAQREIARLTAERDHAVREAAEARQAIFQLRNKLAACCGSGGAGPHTTGPTETFIPEAL